MGYASDLYRERAHAEIFRLWAAPGGENVSQDTDHHDAVTLTIPASPRHAATVRVVAASIAADLGLDVDQIDDLRLGINEAVAVLTDEVSEHDELEIEFTMSPGRLDVEVRCTGRTAVPAPDDLADRILAAVVDHHEYSDGAIRFSKSSIDVA